MPDAAPAPPDREGFSTVDIEGRSWRSLTILLGDPADTRFQAFSTLAPVEERVASIRRLILLIGLLALALTGLAAWVFSSLTVRPLARLQAGAARISGAEDLSTPLPDEGPDEVRSLAGALNGMLARLQASTAATRRFAADAGHELRTPLTGLRANLDTLARNPDLPEAERAALLRESSAEQDRIVHLLEGLQALARGEAAEALPREDVELGDLVDAAVYGARRRHPGVTYELREHDAEGADRARLGQRAAAGRRQPARERGAARRRAGRRRPRARRRPLAAARRRRRPRDPRGRSASGCSSRSRADTARRSRAPGSGWRSSPSRSACTAASCGSRTPFSAGWPPRSGFRRVPDRPAAHFTLPPRARRG